MALSIASLATVKSLLGISDSSQDTVLTTLVGAADSSVVSYLRRSFGRAAFANWPTAGSDTIYLSGNNFQSIAFPYRPLNSIASIYFDRTGYFGKGPSAFSANTLLTEGTDFVIQYDDGGSSSSSGLILRLGGLGSTASAFDDAGDGGNAGGWYGGTGGGGILAGSLATNGRRAAVWQAGMGNLKITANAGFSTIPPDLTHATNLLVIQMYEARKHGQKLTNESLLDYSYALLQSSPGQWPEVGTVRGLLAQFRSAKDIF